MSSSTLQNLLLMPLVYLTCLLSFYYFQLFYVVVRKARSSILKIRLHRILLQWKLHFCWQHMLQWSRAAAKLFHRVMFICQAGLMCNSHWFYSSWNVLLKMHISWLSSVVVTFAWWIGGGETEWNAALGEITNFPFWSHGLSHHSNYHMTYLSMWFQKAISILVTIHEYTAFFPREEHTFRTTSHVWLWMCFALLSLDPKSSAPVQ